MYFGLYGVLQKAIINIRAQFMIYSNERQHSVIGGIIYTVCVGDMLHIGSILCGNIKRPRAQLVLRVI